MKKGSLAHIRLKQESIMRKRRRRKRIIKNRNKRVKKHERVNRTKNNNPYNAPYEAFAPSDFSINNIDGIVSFLVKTDNVCRKNKVKILKVNLDNVTRIDAYAISLMLSLLNRLSCRRINYWGTYPDDEYCKQYIINSGFLDVMKTNIKRPSNRRTGSQIFMIGKDSVDSHRIGRAVRESMVYLTGKEEPYPPVYDDMLEVSANSVEHANSNAIEKNWLVSITLEQGKIHFVLTDTGQGILATLKKKATQQLKDAFLKSDADVLRDVFMKLYQSITGEKNRHKGLPIILESLTDGFISDLQVLTNKVLYNFGTNTPVQLKKGYNGVLYSWTISIENYNNWKNSL